MKTKLFCAFLLIVSLRLPAAPPEVPSAPPALAATEALKFDAESKEYGARTGDVSAPFTFVVTNVSNAEVSITALRTSCGCTVAQLPRTPYPLQPGSNVAINVTMDLRGKIGLITKTVSVESSAGGKTLLVRVNVPAETKIN